MELREYDCRQLVLAVRDTELSDVKDGIVNVVRANVDFSQQHLFRGVESLSLAAILTNGTDRYRKMHEEEVITQTRAANWDICRKCREIYTFDDVVKVESESPAERILAYNCPFKDKTGVPEKSAVIGICPTYTEIAEGPEVIWALYSNGDNEGLLKKYLRIIDSPESRYNHLLIYDASGFRPFDRDRFIFKKGVDKKELLKFVIMLLHEES